MACCSSHSRAYRWSIPVSAASPAAVRGVTRAAYRPRRTPRCTVTTSRAPSRLSKSRPVTCSGDLVDGGHRTASGTRGPERRRSRRPRRPRSRPTSCRRTVMARRATSPSRRVASIRPATRVGCAVRAVGALDDEAVGGRPAVPHLDVPARGLGTQRLLQRGGARRTYPAVGHEDVEVDVVGERVRRGARASPGVARSSISPAFHGGRRPARGWRRPDRRWRARPPGGRGRRSRGAGS